jgi:hypothetical protein
VKLVFAPAAVVHREGLGPGVRQVAEYCSRPDVLARLTTYGYSYAVDRDDLDDTADSTEEARYVDSAIAWAGTLLDEMVAAIVDPASARGQANAWLRDRAIDLSTWRVVTAGGRDAPASLQLSFQGAMDAMDRVRDGAKIPGLVVRHPTGATNHGTGFAPWPRAANVS